MKIEELLYNHCQILWHKRITSNKKKITEMKKEMRKD